MKKLSQAIVLASAMTAGLASVQMAHAEVSASVGVANTYIFRGLDMGNGTPAISGALDYAHSSGAYAGVWATSGDETGGDEYNVYFGFGGEAGDFTYDINYLAYLYPETEAMDLADFGEITLGAGYKDFSAFVSIPVTEDQEGTYVYLNASYSFDKYGIAVGHNAGEEKDGVETYTHVDLSYSYNDNVSFMVTKIVDSDVSGRNDQPRFVVSYSLPISL